MLRHSQRRRENSHCVRACGRVAGGGGRDMSFTMYVCVMYESRVSSVFRGIRVRACVCLL